MDDPVAQPMISSQHDALPVVAPHADDVSDANTATRTDVPVARGSATSSEEKPAERQAENPTENPAENKSLRGNDPMIVFAYDCLRREFGALIARQPAKSATPSPGDVHQMRIATRRLRVALKLFRRMLPKEAQQFRKEFRRFASALGEVRDLDVYSENFRTYAGAVAPENVDDLGGYELHLRRQRAEARNELAALFTDERHAALLQSFAEFLDGAPSPAAMRRWRSFKVADGVDKYLKKSLKRVLKLGDEVGGKAHAKDLHRLRIRAKRLRYELEFFVPVYPSLGKAAKATKVLQDLLGVHQDACTATERLRAYARSLRESGGRAMPAALGTLIEGQQQQARDARERFGAEWRTFERAVSRGKLAA
jgi:CHAD domain-containing protein